MNLPKCNGCHNQIQWSKVFKSYWSGYKPIQCQKCKTELKVTFSSRTSTAISQSISTALIIFIFLYYQLNIYLGALVIILVSFLISLLFPFIIKYNNKTTLTSS